MAKSVNMADNDFDPDNDPLTVSKSSSIRVPSLEEIVSLKIWLNNKDLPPKSLSPFLPSRNLLTFLPPRNLLTFLPSRNLLTFLPSRNLQTFILSRNLRLQTLVHSVVYKHTREVLMTIFPSLLVENI